MPKKSDQFDAYDAANHFSDQPHYKLRLYITGTTPRSLRAVANTKRICEEYLQNRYLLEVIDIYQQPSLAQDDQIIAVPTLVKKLPSPLKKLVGDMSDTSQVLLGLDIKPLGNHETS